MPQNTQSPQSDHNSKVAVDYDELAGFLAELEDKGTAISEANGRLRSRLKEIIENRNWNKKALSVIREIDKMSQTGRADFLRTFEPMFEEMYSNKWADEVSDMLDGSGVEDD